MFSERLKALRKDRGMTQKQMAEKLFVTQATVSAWECGVAMPDGNKLQSLAQILNVTVSSLIGDDTKSIGVTIPVLGRVQAGIPIEMISEILDYEEIPSDMAERGDYFGLLVRGDSMNPRILDGDVVIVRCQPDVENGDIAVVAVNGDSATVKKIRKSALGMTLIPLNPAYDTIFYTNEQIATLPVEIKGKVVELRGKL